MFTQLLGFNTNRCNGCPERCRLDAVEHKRKKDVLYRPSITNHADITMIKTIFDTTYAHTQTRKMQ